MKKLLSMFITLFVLITSVTACSAQDTNEVNKNDITIVLQIDNPVMTVNGRETNIDENNTAPVITSGRTLVPIRTIIERFGGNVEWNADTREVILTYKSDVIKLTIDSQTAYLNDKENSLDMAPAVINRRTMLPIRFIAESFGFNTEWKESERTIIIKNSEEKENNEDMNNAADENINTMYIKFNGTSLTAELADNSSTKALIELLKKGNITINMSDYGNFEKVGNLGTSLPKNDEQITTSAGDLILYQGNNFVIYYDTNSWSFTRLGKIKNISADELKSLLGDGDVTVILSLN